MKLGFCGQDVPKGPTAKKELPVPDYRKDQEILDAEPVSIVRFNAFHASEGVQAIPKKTLNGEKNRFRVEPCGTVWLGDLRCSTVPRLQRNAKFYDPFNHLVVLEPKKEPAVALEVQRALYLSFSSLAGLKRLPPLEMEYLLLLSRIASYPSADQENKPLKHGKPTGKQDAESAARELALRYFALRLNKAYGFTLDDLHAAMIQMDPDYRKYPFELQNLRDCIRKEYAWTFRGAFGISYDDAQEVVSDVPMI